MTSPRASSEPLKRVTAIQYAAKLAALGARPPTIAGLLPYLAESVIKDVYAEITGERSRRGPTPYTLSAHFTSPSARIEATYVLLTFLRHRSTGVHDIDAMLATYSRYCQLFANQVEQKNDLKRLTFDRFWSLIRAYSNERVITLETCPACGNLHIHNPVEILTAKDCPLRKLVEDLDKPVMRSQKKEEQPANSEQFFPLHIVAQPTQARLRTLS